ncbi:hypothetical protein AXE77_04435 [Gardnerella vaginalis]|uniref:Uncharacterized protein n=1 Tax=Gardnerella vaginalis TaxID=2702 RepID=A0A3E1IZQ3_GARVA|nr:hypothetical protein AXE77_04435 [Gardnerella vaginalis]
MEHLPENSSGLRDDLLERSTARAQAGRRANYKKKPGGEENPPGQREREKKVSIMGFANEPR